MITKEGSRKIETLKRESFRAEVDFVDPSYVILEMHHVKHHLLSLAYRVVANDLLLC